MGAEPAPFAAGRGSHRKACDLRNAAPCTGSIFGRPALGAKLWAPSWRHSPRVAAPTEKRATCTTQRHARAQFVGGPPSGRSFWAPSRRHSPRVAAPTEMRATCTAQRHARAQFVGGPPSGRSFSGSEPAPFAAGRASHRKACDLRNAAPCTGSICGEARPRGEAFGHRAGAIRRGSRLLQKCVRPAQRSAMHGLNLWEARPRGEAFRAPSRPFAAGRGSYRKSASLHKATPGTGSICGRPALGAKLFGHRAGAIRRGSRLPTEKRAACIRRRLPKKKNRRRGSAGQCGGYCDSTSVTAWRNAPVRSCGLPGSSRSIRSELPRQTSLPSFAS